MRTIGKKNGILAFCRSFFAWAALLVCGLLFALALLFSARLEQDELVFFSLDRVYLTLPLLLAGVALLYFVYRLKLWQRVRLGRLRLVLAAYVLVLGTAWVFMSRSAPFADAEVVYGFAQRFLVGDFDPIAEGYLGHYPHQLTLALYYELAMRLVGTDSFFFLQMVNVGNVAVSYLLLSYIAAELFHSRRVQLFTCLLLFGLLPPILYVTFIYGTQPGLTCALLAVYAALRFGRTRQRRWLAVCAAAITVAILFKMNYWIYAIGILLYLLFDILKKPSVAVCVCMAGVLAGGLLGPQAVYKSYEIRSGHTVTAGTPSIMHIAMGMQEGERGPGWFNGYTNEKFDGYDKNYAEATATAKADITQRLGEFGRNPVKALDFYGRKTISQWGDGTFAAIQVSYFGGQNLVPLGYIATSLYWGGLRQPVEFVMEIYLLLIYAAALACFVLRRKTLPLAALLPAIILLGGFAFHILWEAKSQYTWPYFVLLVPYAAAGLCSVFGQLEKYVKNNQ